MRQLSGLDELYESVERELAAAGLRSADLETGEGGYAIQVGEASHTGSPCVLVVWSASAGLTDQAFEAIRSGQQPAAVGLHVGRIKHLMADAISGVLVSAGMVARISSDGLAPAVVEVLPA